MADRGRIQPRWLWAILVCVMAGIVGRTVWGALAHRRAQRAPAQFREALQHALRQGAERLPVYGDVPAFTLTDHHGRPITRAHLTGHVWIADFIFTRCGGQCLTMAAQMGELQRTLSPAIRLVSFSVDPGWDTSSVLTDYAARVGAQDERWVFVTGSQEEIYRLSRDGFRLGVAAEGGTVAEPIIHSVRFVLVDRAGRIRGYYDGTDADALTRLQLDAETALKADAP